MPVASPLAAVDHFVLQVLLFGQLQLQQCHPRLCLLVTN
jgi:hypothetical protein